MTCMLCNVDSYYSKYIGDDSVEDVSFSIDMVYVRKVNINESFYMYDWMALWYVRIVVMRVLGRCMLGLLLVDDCWCGLGCWVRWFSLVNYLEIWERSFFVHSK